MTASDNLDQRRRQRLQTLLASAEREGARIQFWARTVALAAVALFFAAFVDWDAAFAFTFSTLVLFFFIGLLHYRLVKTGHNPVWLGFVLGTLDIIFLTFLIVGPNPFSDIAMPPALSLREAGFKYLLIFVCLGALTLSPRLAAWLGIAAAVSWTAAVVWVVMRPGTIIAQGDPENMLLGEKIRLYLNPNFVDIIDQLTHVVVILIITGIIAAVVSRSRRLADDYTKAERARGNLARHFSPNVVDELASADEPFGPVRRQDVAVLFADIVGFTNYSEDHPAEEVFELLRSFHRRMEQAVFDHGGTVDNYIGDCLMATFGVPSPAKDDAARALRCARAMASSVDEWNAKRRAHGALPVDVRIGCQYGPVVLGAIGSERNLSFAVVGDTCNVASRLQTLCRELKADICVGAALIAAVKRAGDQGALSGLTHHGEIHVRGRDNPVDVWISPKRDSEAASAGAMIASREIEVSR
ncbi:MAG: adenylate/guanylate cyclase domain-containing protein [Pseudaminobacter sp.]|nr:adenylate/guanylate cyclase domain-containing protein [Pseudaminobacter sp.]